MPAAHGRVPVGTLFGLSALHSCVTPDDVSEWLGVYASQRDAQSIKREVPTKPALEGHHHHAHHNHRITSASIEVQGRIPAYVFDNWLDTLIALKGPDILRIKGIVHVEGVDYPFVFHGVQHIFDAPVPLENWKAESLTSRVVVIARDMDKEDLEASLATLRMPLDKIKARTEGMMADVAEMPF